MSHQDELIAKDIKAYLERQQRKDLLRFLTCGNVDDGKSTLIGRLLHDSKMIYEDQLAAIKADSKKFNTTGGEEMDLALLVDGLQAEREQGITIDVAYRYFSTEKRKFIIADTPGHEQYTRNMATGASTCDLAIILIDGRNGVQTQTRRHTFIVSLLGIKHVIVAINKMDLVGWSEEKFEAIKKDYLGFAKKVDIPDITFIPLSALKGDNVVHASASMPWYKGPTLMSHLESVPVASDRNLTDFRFPVQFVNRRSVDFRGYAGTVASGVVRKGEELMILPSHKTNTVKSILSYEGELEEAFAGQAVTLTFAKEVDISRGDLLASPSNLPHVDTRFEAMLVWMSDEPMSLAKPYFFKLASKLAGGMVTDLRCRLNVNTLEKEHANRLQLNEIAHVTVDLSQAVAFDAYRKNRQTGAFVVVDRVTNNTVGAGMILEREQAAREIGVIGLAVEALNEYGRRHVSQITPEERAKKLGQRPATVLLTGLVGSGKSTLAYALERRLFDLGRSAYVLDGQSAKLGAAEDVDFGPELSDALKKCAEIAAISNDAGQIVIAPLVARRIEDRAMMREIVGRDRFVEIYLSAPIEVCRQRDAAGLYKQADVGLLRRFPGVSRRYDVPEAPDLELPTHTLGVEPCVDRIVDLLRRRGFIS
ncbi:MAG TPA: sulfate adenylyltransferase subunit CysN [Planctomycetota bacterium]